jgi:hypothetical protein
MYLRHGTVDTPMRTKSAPAADELLFGFLLVSCRLIYHPKIAQFLNFQNILKVYFFD